MRMISVECGEYGTNGIADLSEAVEVARLKGIANARQAINPDLYWGLHSLGQMLALGFWHDVPGIEQGATRDGVANYVVFPNQAPKMLRTAIRSAEAAVKLVAGERLPNWNPSRNIPGIRLVTMTGGAEFQTHTDTYR